MLSLEHVDLTLTAGEEKVKILDDIDLVFEMGGMYAITGPNGSGKSSVARVIMGIYRQTAGRVIFQKEDISDLSVTERARRGFGYAFQHPARFKGLKVKDLIEVALQHGELADCKCLRNIGLCPDDYLERTLDNSLSGGEIKRIEIATLLAQNPKIRIFDEPEAGIDLWSFEQLIDVIGTSHGPDKITIIISHQEKILNMVDEIVLVTGGGVQMKGSCSEIWPRIRDSASCVCRQNCKKDGEIYADCPR